MPLEGDALAAWLNQRVGCLTASRMGAALDRLKNGQPSAKCNDLIKSILAERMTGDTVRTFVNDAMQWGLEKQAEAVAAYEAHTGEVVEATDIFVPHPSIQFFGATPDGYIGRDGLIEIKAPTTVTFVEWRLAGTVPEQHIPQMLAQLACTGRRWVEFVAFDPRVRGGLDKQLFIRRFEPPAEEIVRIEREAAEFLATVDKFWEALNS